MKKNVKSGATSQLCAECKGIGSVQDPQNTGNFMRCTACGGTGLATPPRKSTPVPETDPAVSDKE
jgi:DnaJ-class molecular chaperone